MTNASVGVPYYSCIMPGCCFVRRLHKKMMYEYRPHLPTRPPTHGVYGCYAIILLFYSWECVFWLTLVSCSLLVMQGDLMHKKETPVFSGSYKKTMYVVSYAPIHDTFIIVPSNTINTTYHSWYTIYIYIYYSLKERMRCFGYAIVVMLSIIQRDPMHKILSSSRRNYLIWQYRWCQRGNK